MKGNEFKTNTVVIMDGSDKAVVDYIASMLEAWNTYAGRPKVYQLDENHPSIKVVVSRLEESDIDVVNRRIEARFPGLCIFNPPMAV